MEDVDQDSATPLVLRCLYDCDELLTAGSEPAHVVPSAIGGRKTSKRTACPDCNRAVGADERELCESLRFFTGSLGIRQGDNDVAPAAKWDAPDLGTVTVQKGAIEPKEIQAVVTEEIEGKLHFQVSGNPDINKIALRLAHLLRQYRKTPDDLLNDGAVVRLARTYSFRPALQSTINLGEPAHQRAIAKMALELLAVNEPSLARGRELAAFRSAILNKGTVDAVLDLHTNGSGLLPASLPPFAHTVEVWSAGTQLAGRVCLCGFFPFTIALSSEWRGGPLMVAYAVDPVGSVSVVDCKQRRDGALPAGWPQRPPQNGEEVQRQAQVFLDSFHALVNEQSVGHATKQLVQQWKESLRDKVKPGEPIPTDSLADLTEKAADLGVHLRYGGEMQRAIGLDEILPLIRQHFEALSHQD